VLVSNGCYSTDLGRFDRRLLRDLSGSRLLTEFVHGIQRCCFMSLDGDDAVLGQNLLDMFAFPEGVAYNLYLLTQ
jgi:hypothetical protein